MPKKGYKQTLEVIIKKKIFMKQLYDSPKGILIKKQIRQKLSGKNHYNYIDGRSYGKLYYCKCGKKIDKYGRSKECYKCRSLHNNPFKGKKHSKETLKIIGEKSKIKFTKEYLEKVRKTYEKRGLWIPIKAMKPYLLYRKEANWRTNIFNFLSKEELNIFNMYGLFSSNNSKGLVRDHKYSRYSGFLNKIPPIILRHPVNCQLITHKENLSKAKKGNRYRDGDSISLKTLFNNILNFKNNWFEQKECIIAINNYKKEFGAVSEEEK